jgi:membrane-associated phospholipid phosphatase
VTRPQLLGLAIASTVIAALGLGFLDLPVARWIGAHEQSSLWETAVKILEVPAGITPSPWTAPIVLVGGVLLSLAVARWHRHAPSWMYLAIVYLLTRNLMAWGKALTGRYRPSQWLNLGGDTFGHVGDGVSFPSGHVVAFAGLVLPLALIAPRTRPLLAVVAFIMVARVAVLAHFVSDVFAGLALTAFLAWACAPIIASSAMTTAGAPARR